MPDEKRKPLGDLKPLYIRSLGRTAEESRQPPPAMIYPDFKRQWAKKHLEKLHRLMKRFCNLHPYEIRAHENLEAGIICIETVHPPLPEATCVVLALGDFIGSLRSSLDHLIWQLASLSGKRPRHDIFFPVCEQNTVDSQVRIAKATFGVPDDAITLIKSFQPYHAGDAYKSTHLWRLNTLWNIDKHRHISAFSTITTWQYCLRDGYRHGEELPVQQVDNRTIMTLPIAYKSEVEFNPELTGDLRFFDDFEGIEIGYSDLVEMYEFVTDKVLPAFTGFFSHPKI